MTCRDLADFLVNYIDGALPPVVHRQFEAHLDECAACVAYLRTYRETIRLTAASGDEELMPAMPEELVQAIVAAARR
jgi:anti-sigma factor RsiW